MNTFQTYFIDVFKNKYADFSGRARRAEYWYFTLYNFIFSFAVGFIDGLVGAEGIIVGIYTLVIFIPGLATAVRRLHDVGKSGWFYLIVFIPIVGAIWLLILFCTEGESRVNEYGSNPKFSNQI